MEFLAEHVIPPTGHYLQLLEFLAVMVYLVHLPYIGLVIGTIALSMFLTFRNREVPDPRFDRFAGDLIDTFLGNRTTMLVLGIMPLLVLPFIYAQWFAGLDATPLRYIPWVIPAVAIAFVLVARYASSFRERQTQYARHMLMGMAAVGLLKISYFVLLSSVARLHDPEKWYRIKNIVIMLLNWNVIWKFTFFLHAAGAITGAAVLFFFFSWRSGEMARDRDYAQFVRKFGGGIALAFTFALPVYYVFYIFTTPDVAFDNGVYLLATSVSFVAMITALLLFGVLGSDRPRYGGAVFSLLLVVFLLAGTVDLRSMSRANYEHYHARAAAAEAQKAVKEAEIESRLAQAGGAAMGEEVFNNVCSQCHRMDEKLVGPPLNEVLPKYDVAGLKAFVASPTKVNPDYPPMPNLGLTTAQINAVVAYLKGDEEGGGGGEGGTGH